MEEESLRSATSSQETTQADSPKDSQHQGNNDKEIPVEEEEEPLPPSFHRMLMEETLRNDDCPYVFWESIRIPIL